MSSERTTRERLEEIEDRKIEILLEIGRANKRYGKAVSRLESEYDRLDVEHFRLKVEMLRDGQH
jgi:hypothetical protein